jgi:PIN domain nuclease of toxin-antitoxin system
VEIAIFSEHAARVANLPKHHADPFDRLLVAQTMMMPARLVTADTALIPCSELIDWIGK